MPIPEPILWKHNPSEGNTGDTQKPSGDGSEQPALGGPACTGSWTSRGPCQSPPSGVSVTGELITLEKIRHLILNFICSVPKIPLSQSVNCQGTRGQAGSGFSMKSTGAENAPEKEKLLELREEAQEPLP